MTATLGAVAVVAVALLGGSDVGDGPAMSAQVGGSSWLGTDAIGPIITEVVSSNASTLADEDGDQPDWIELHNPTHEPLDLDGYHLSDDEDDPARWPLPAVVLEPDAHLVVFASGKDRRDPDGELHTDFRLAQGDEPVLLVEPEGATIADHIDAIDIPRNASFGRPPTQLSRTCYFAFPSPGRHNSDECFDDTDLGAPTLSHTTGFYDEPFDLEITSSDPDATIYYTLDGSYPDPDTNPDNTLVYDGTLRIVDRTPQPNTISMIPTTVPEHREFIAPDHEVPKGTAIRARTRHSATTVATYFVGDVPPHGDLSIVALTVDPDYLFDHDIGIHVGGRLAEEWRRSEDYEVGAHWLRVDANFMWRGREWERPLRSELHNAVTFDFCDTVTTCDFQQHVGLRIHGGFSRHLPNKSLRLYARSDYGEAGFQYPFFDNGVSDHKRLILRNSGNDWARLRFADAFFQSLMGPLHADTQAARPSVLYINGEYWGIHNLRERQDEHYLAAVHGVDPDQIDLLDNSTSRRNEVRRADPPPDGFDIANPYDQELVDDWFDFVATTAGRDPTDPAFVPYVDDHIDTASFFDFVIGHTFPGVSDWPGNTRWWRSSPSDRDASGTLDGRWRWMIADLDSWGSGRADVAYNPLADRLPTDTSVRQADGYPLLFNSLVANPELRDRFVTRFADLLNAILAERSTIHELRAWEDRFTPDMHQQRVRWNTGDIEEWHEALDQLAVFLTERPAIQRQQLRERFELGDDRQVTVEFDPTQATVELNTIQLTDWLSDDNVTRSDVTWNGIYFHGQTLHLRAIPTADARFSHWLVNGDTQLTDEHIEIPLDADLHLRLMLTGDE